MKILILNGPNLNMLQYRDPAQYGTRSMEQIILDVQRMHPEVRFTYYQSNHEGDLIDRIQEVIVESQKSRGPQRALLEWGDSKVESKDTYAGIILNAGGYTHTSVALRDAVELCPLPVVEVHLSDIHNREPFRRVSLLTDVCATQIIGKNCYEEAVRYLLSHAL